MKINKIILSLILLMPTISLADQLSSTGYENLAEEYVSFQYTPRELATMNFRTVCDKIKDSDSANCSVRVYDGNNPQYDAIGSHLDTHEMFCSENNCESR